ncbi:P-selectin isoform X2 [Lepisosteus oculatus]|uniref:P-selectin isoform X2 n=1 Tax=Lepisosteus oculatus TaxID=7918 RepID=UPI003721E265
MMLHFSCCLNWIFQFVMQAVTMLVISNDFKGDTGVQAWTYHYNITPNMDWNTASDWCKKYYTNMVAIQNQREIAYLNEMLPPNANYYWIGIRKINDTWTWIGTNKALTKETENWATGEPNNIGKFQDCVEIYIKRKLDTAKWNDERCNRKKGVICFKASCTESSCSPWGECVETIGSYTCQCFEGFEGPYCEAVGCEVLQAPAHGTMNCTHIFKPFHFNSTCAFQCARGYELRGSQHLRCQASGAWTADTPACQAVKCEVLTTPSHGIMDCEHPIAPFSYSSSCRLGCEEGFLLNGSNSTQCTAQGLWTETTQNCQAHECAPLRAPDRGLMNCSHPHGEFRFGSRCELDCEEGFVLRGSNTLQCTASGLWTHTLPSCQAVKCEELTAPSHGIMDCQHPIENFSYTSSCRLGCAEGFLLNGANVTQCTSQGLWTERIPVCQAHECAPLRAPDRGLMNCSHPHGEFRFGSRCELDCEEGFVLRGSNTLQCTASGLWTQTLPTCQAVKCEELTAPSHGIMDCQHPIENFSYTSSCRLGCAEGFLLNGANVTQCTSQGLWTERIPVCQAHECAPLRAPDRGLMNCSHPHGEFRFGSRCELDCKKGFVLRGSNTLQCTVSGLWTQTLPSCQAVKCEELTAPSHGIMDCQHPIENFSYTSSCRLGCAEGFLLNGANATQCTSQGLWTERIPVCQAHKCTSLRVPQHSAMNCSHPYGEFSFNSTCEIDCEEGFLLNGANFIQCTSQGQWTDSTPVCQAHECAPLRAPDRGLMNCSHPHGEFRFGSRCELDCEEGFVLRGSNTLQCTVSGLWTQTLPSCQAVKCEELTAPSHGIMDCQHPIENFSYTSSCRLGCAEGFLLNGANATQCTSQGLWTERIPVCQAHKCTSLRVPQHSAMNCSHPYGEFSFNSTCEIDCEEGFLLNGANFIQCTSQGQWTDSTPVCQAHECAPLRAPDRGLMNCSHPHEEFRFGSRCELDCEEGFVLRGSNTLQCTASGLWTHTLPTCQAVKCEELTAPSHGIMECQHPIENFSYTSSCRLGCAEGFLLNGANATQCTSQGLWTERIPVCQAHKCTSLRVPQHSAMNCSHPYGEFSFNSTCEIDCEEGFLLNGANFIQCTSQGQWTDSTPVCQAHECAPLRAPDRGLMNCSHPHEEFRFGSRCELDCEEGFVLRGSNTLQCTASGLWAHTLPTCQVIECKALLVWWPLIINCSHPLGNFSFRSKCDFSCSKGYRLNGTKETSCNSFGFWSDLQPSCEALEIPIGMAMLIYTGVGAGAGLSLLLLSGGLFFIVKRLSRRGSRDNKLYPNRNNSVMEELENPAFEAM